MTHNGRQTTTPGTTCPCLYCKRFHSESVTAMTRLSSLCLLLLLMCVFLEVTGNLTASSCPVHTDGCSIPCGSPFPYKTMFTPACNKHDVCYSCGQLHGWTLAQCDTAFKNDMYRECEQSIMGKRFLTSLWNWLKGVVSDKVKRCKAGADIYYNAVYYFGHASLEKLSPAWCQAPCKKSLGDPNKGVERLEV